MAFLWRLLVAFTTTASPTLVTAAFYLSRKEGRRPSPPRFKGSSGKATRDVEGADDPHEKEKARMERKIERAMLAYFQGLQKRVMGEIRRRRKEKM